MLIGDGRKGNADRAEAIHRKCSITICATWRCGGELLYGRRGPEVQCEPSRQNQLLIGDACQVAQQIIDTFGWLAYKALADGDDPAVSDGALLGDRMGLVVPSVLLQQRNYSLAARVGLVRYSSSP